MFVDHPDAKPLRFSLKPWWSARELAAEWNVGDYKAVQRMLADEQVYPRAPGRGGKRKVYWLSDIRNSCPNLMESWAEIIHQRELARIREREAHLPGDQAA